MTCNSGQLILEKLKTPINLESLNPNFEQERVILEMTVADLENYMKRYGIGLFYRRDEILKGKKTTPSPNRKRIRLSSAGSDIYLCKRSKDKIATGLPVLRNRTSKACGCKARFTIQFPHGYRHGPSNEINVVDHEDEKAKITWNWKHNHDFNDPKLFAELPLSRDAKSLLRSAVLDYGVTWHQIFREQTKVWQSDHPGPCELLKINERHVRYILKERISNQPFKGTPNVVSLGILLNNAQSSGGLSQHTTEFKSLDGSSDSECLEGSQEPTHDFTESQEAAQSKERETELSVNMIDQRILKSLKRILVALREVHSVEKRARAVDTFDILSRKFLLHLRNSHAKQKH